MKKASAPTEAKETQAFIKYVFDSKRIRKILADSLAKAIGLLGEKASRIAYASAPGRCTRHDSAIQMKQSTTTLS